MAAARGAVCVAVWFPCLDGASHQNVAQNKVYPHAAATPGDPQGGPQGGPRGAGGEGGGPAGPPRVEKSGPPGAPPGGLAGALGLCLCDLYHAAWACSVFV